MADGCHLEKIDKLPYLSNRLTDVHEIWHGDASWSSKPDRPLNILMFKNPRWRTVLQQLISFNTLFRIAIHSGSQILQNHNFGVVQFRA